MEGLDDVFGEPNGPAYEKRQERTGPPLEYVSEKLSTSLRELHDLIRSVERFVPDDLLSPTRSQAAAIPIKSGFLLGSAHGAFYHALVAFLALGNLLALANDGGLVDRLLGYDAEEFDDWIRQIERGGSVTG